jgi:hypothetical protein
MTDSSTAKQLEEKGDERKHDTRGVARVPDHFLQRFIDDQLLFLTGLKARASCD